MSKQAKKYRFKTSWGEHTIGSPANPDPKTLVFLLANGIVEEVGGEAEKVDPVVEVVADELVVDESPAVEPVADEAPAEKPKRAKKAK